MEFGKEHKRVFRLARAYPDSRGWLVNDDEG